MKLTSSRWCRPSCGHRRHWDHRQMSMCRSVPKHVEIIQTHRTLWTRSSKGTQEKIQTNKLAYTCSAITFQSEGVVVRLFVQFSYSGIKQKLRYTMALVQSQPVNACKDCNAACSHFRTKWFTFGLSVDESSVVFCPRVKEEWSTSMQISLVARVIRIFLFKMTLCIFSKI